MSALIFVSYVIVIISTNAPTPHQPVVEFDKPLNVPAWNSEYAESFPNCTGEKALVEKVVVVDQQNDAKVISFDLAHKLTNNDIPADDVWVVGFC
jgi:hypothetical protein